MRSKKELAVTLSRLAGFEKPSLLLEQYPTDSEIAAEVLWFAQLNNDIQGKTIADLGCGTGILGIGALLFGPKKVYFVDIDERPLKKLEANLRLFDLNNYEIFNSDVAEFNEPVDVIFQNPPFGTKAAHADRVFLEKAFRVADVIYSFHKISTRAFVEAISKDNGFAITHFFELDFPLKQSHAFHKKRIERIEVGCWRLQRIS